MNDKFIRRTIYGLKKCFKQPVNIYQLAVESTDLITGDINRDYVITHIRDAIILPVKQYRSLIPLIRPLSWYDASTALIIVEDQKLDYKDHFEFQGERYAIIEIHAFGMYLVQKTEGIVAIGKSEQLQETFIINEEIEDELIES